MRKILLSMAMALCMVFCLLPTVATAEIRWGVGFEYNTELKVLTISANEGFENFRKLNSYRNEVTSIDISTSVTKIGDGALAGLINLPTITIPDSVTEIGESTFNGCKGLKSVTLPSNITSIPKTAFYNCTSLESITIPNYVTAIGDSAFEECKKLSTITLSENLESIAYSAFYACTSLESITIPSKVNSIGAYVFSRCDSLTSANFQNSMKDLPKGIFEDSSKLSSVTLPRNLLTIGDFAFSNTGLTSINIPETLTKLGQGSFSKCSNLSTVIFESPSALKEIKGSCFSGCTSLESITLPENLESIGSFAFQNCTSLTSANFQNTMTGLPEHIFDKCSKLSSVTLPSNLLTIGDYAFRNTGLTSINIPETLTTLGAESFKNCSNLSTVIFESPSELKSIGNSAFYGTSLESITLPENLESIGESAFRLCTSLTSANFQNTMTGLPNYIFDDCYNLNSVTLPSNLLTIGDYAFRKTGLTSINIPETLTTLGAESFYNCSKLSTVIFESPSALKEIKGSCFSDCDSLKFITIPSQVTSIGIWSGLKDITIVMEPTVAPTIQNNSLDFTNYKIYVPKDGKGYIETKYWRNTVSGNVGLTNLTLSSGELSSAFSLDQYSYTATVPAGTSSITVTPTSLRGETITVNGSAVASGNESNTINLTVDPTIVIQATYGSTTETYTVEVTKVVDTFALDTQVTAPAKNVAPNTSTINTAQYTGTVSWKDSSGSAVGSKFLGGTAYTATVTLTPNKGYTFQGVLANQFTYPNATVTHSAGGSGDLIVSIAFDRTTKADAPTVTFSFDGDNANKLMGANNTMQYSLDGESTWYDCSENITLAADQILADKDIKVRIKATETAEAGEVQTIDITKAATPDLTVSSATVGVKGTITGVTDKMEYKLSSVSTWTSVDGNPIYLDPGDYQVRVKTTGMVLASEIKELTIVFEKGTPCDSDLTYSLTAEVVYDGNIKPLSVEAGPGKNLGEITVYYNGSTSAPVNAGTYSITVDIAGNDEYIDATGLLLGDYTIQKANHTGNTTASKTVRANKAETNLTVALPTDLPEGASFATSGTVDGSTALIATHSLEGTTLTFSTASYEASTATITIPVTGAKNYNDYVVVVTITAEDKEIVIISGLTAASDLVYDGLPQIGYTGTVTVSESKVPTDELIYTYTSTDGGGYNSTDAPTNAGAYKLVVSVAEDNNDFAGAHADLAFIIAKQEIAIPAEDGTEFTYSGEEQTYVVFSSDAYTVSNNNQTNAGAYSVTVALTDKANMQWADDKNTNDKTFNFVIQKVSATVIADNKTKIEGEIDPVFTFTSSGFVNGESINGVTFSLTGSTITPEGGTVSGGGNGNYNITYEVGTLTIRPAQEVLVEIISAATTAKTGVVASDKTPGEVSNGQKFVSAELMTTLNNAIAGAQQQITEDATPSDDPGNPVLDAITALDNALQAFINGIQTGTMSTSTSTSTSSSSGGGYTPPEPVTKIDNGGSITGANLDLLVSKGKTLTVDGDKGETLVFDTEALKGIGGHASGDIKVEIKDVSSEHQQNLPGKQVFSLTVSSGNSTISNFGGKVIVSLPYELKVGETADKVTVWHLADDGTMTEIPCTYDPVTKLATFEVTHFSMYAVGVADAATWSNPFSDVSNSDWFYGAVEFANRNGLFAGTGADTFSPNSPMTRAMLWTVLGRLDGQSLSGSGVFDAARSWAMGAGITDGTNPDGSITREQMVTILWRYAGSPNTGDELSKFSDGKNVASYAADAMAWAVEKGIVTGANGALMPKDNATRAQVAAILQRFIKETAK